MICSEGKKKGTLTVHLESSNDGLVEEYALKNKIPVCHSNGKIRFVPADIDCGLSSVSSSLEEKTSLRRGVRLKKENTH